MNMYLEALTLVGAFISSAFWVMRIALQQQRAITDRFIEHLEHTLEQQRCENKLHREALGKLTGAVDKQSKIIAKAYQLKLGL